ncbi:3-dehydroquinate synthase [bacterium]|nr:3-dehydroquinate synthase [bacterium]
MRQTLKVQTEESCEYLIDITDNKFSKLNQEIYEYTHTQKRLVVISKKVHKLYSEELDFKEEELLILPDGEQEKNIKNYLKIIERASQMGLTRKDVIIAVGGGVIGDIAGFAASTYMRGIDFIQVPTTLLSAVDSSVGGKTAIDLQYGKNLLGTFYQPKKVFININFFKTLDNRQNMSGLGEVLKYAFIENSCGYKVPQYLFEFLTLGCEKIMAREPLTLIRIIEYCLNLKIAVVNQDEKEGGLRKVLNFGHTLAHALETITKYKKYTHGEAVVYGIFFIFDWAYKQGQISYSYYRLSLDLLEKYGFKPLKKKYSPQELVEIMKHDKKASPRKITFIVPSDKKEVHEIKLSPKQVRSMLAQI